VGGQQGQTEPDKTRPKSCVWGFVPATEQENADQIKTGEGGGDIEDSTCTMRVGADVFAIRASPQAREQSTKRCREAGHQSRGRAALKDRGSRRAGRNALTRVLRAWPECAQVRAEWCARTSVSPDVHGPMQQGDRTASSSIRKDQSQSAPFQMDVARFVRSCLIRLTHTPATCGCASLRNKVGHRSALHRQRCRATSEKAFERVEASVEAKREFVEVGL